MSGPALRPNAAVTVPATSANLGPGFDCLGLALNLRDHYSVAVTNTLDVRVHIEGADAHGLPTDDTHLVARSLTRALEHLGAAAPGLQLHCRNRIPQGRGLGSSAAAIVGGVALAFALIAQTDADFSSQQRAEILALAAEIEGHPDNVAPATYGGFTIAWIDQATDQARAVSLPVAAEVAAVLFVPEDTSPTHTARAVLPESVPFSTATFNVARSALLVAALTTDPTLLLDATADRLHQQARRDNYPEAMALVDQLRAAGVPAAVSGAGPSVLALGEPDRVTSASALAGPAYQPLPIEIGRGVGVETVNDGSGAPMR